MNIYKKRIAFHTDQKNVGWCSGHGSSRLDDRVRVWTPREAQKLCVCHSRGRNARLNDAVAIVTHQFSESPPNQR